MSPIPRGSKYVDICDLQWGLKSHNFTYSLLSGASGMGHPNQLLSMHFGCGPSTTSRLSSDLCRVKLLQLRRIPGGRKTTQTYGLCKLWFLECFLSWALEPERRILMFIWCWGPPYSNWRTARCHNCIHSLVGVAELFHFFDVTSLLFDRKLLSNGIEHRKPETTSLRPS